MFVCVQTVGHWVWCLSACAGGSWGACALHQIRQQEDRERSIWWVNKHTHTLSHSTICYWQAVHLSNGLISCSHNSLSHSRSSSAGKLKFGIYRQLWILGPLPARYVCVHSWCVWIMPSSYLCFVIFFNSTINILVVVTFTYDKTYQPQDVTTSLFFLLVTSVSLK